MRGDRGAGVRSVRANSRPVPSTLVTRASRLARRQRWRRDCMLVMAVVLGVFALVRVPGLAEGTWSDPSANGVSTFATVLEPQPPADVTATLACEPGSATVAVAWTPSGWEDGFTIQIFKAVGKDRKLIETYDVPAPAIGYTIDVTGWASGRYVVEVSGYDESQSLTGLETDFQKTGSCA